jgi:hypothetical protein
VAQPRWRVRRHRDAARMLIRLTPRDDLRHARGAPARIGDGMEGRRRGRNRRPCARSAHCVTRFRHVAEAGDRVLHSNTAPRRLIQRRVAASRRTRQTMSLVLGFAAIGHSPTARCNDASGRCRRLPKRGGDRRRDTARSSRLAPPDRANGAARAESPLSPFWLPLGLGGVRASGKDPSLRPPVVHRARAAESVSGLYRESFAIVLRH